MRTLNTMFKEGDFVKYCGSEVFEPKPVWAKIIEFKTTEENCWVGLMLENSDEKISVRCHEIRSIDVEERHLVALGFRVEGDREKVYVKSDELKISMCGINDVANNAMFFSGFCVGDFRNFDPQACFDSDGILNKKMFYSVFPSVNNINDLFKYLAGIGIVIEDKVKILNT